MRSLSRQSTPGIGFTAPRKLSFNGFPASGGNAIVSAGTAVSGRWSSRWRISVRLAAALVVEVHQGPRRVARVGGLQHGLARLGVGGVLLARLQVDGRQLPLLHRVGQALGEALLLLRLVHREPVLEQQHAVVHQQLLELRRLLQEGGRLFGACRSPSPAPRRRGCTSCGRRARSRRPRAGAARSAGSTTACARGRSAWPAPPRGTGAG